MSKIVSPVPPIENGEIKSCEGKLWWRLRLRPNADGHSMTYRYGGGNGDAETATWMECEFFDGADDHIDMGLDKITFTALWITTRNAATFIDILHDEKPTASTLWERLSPVGYPHPEWPDTPKSQPGITPM